MSYHYAKGAVAARSAASNSKTVLPEERLHPTFRFPRATIQAVQKLGRSRAIGKVLAWRHPGTLATEADAARYLDDCFYYFKKFEVNREQ